MQAARKKAPVKRRLSKPVLVRHNRSSTIIDEACEEVTRQLARPKDEMSAAKIARESGVSISTLRKMKASNSWGYSPHLKTVQFVMEALGYEMKLTKRR